MEKQRNEGKPEVFDLENESPDSPTFPPLPLGEGRGEGENAENSESFPPQKITNPPETNKEEPAEKPAPSEEDQEDGQESDNAADPQLEGRIAELEQQLEQSETRRREGEEKLSATQKSLAEAVSRYRAMLLESMPEAPETMVVGETVAEVDRSFAEAKTLVQRVRREVEEKLAKERLPAGSPTRSPANFSALTPMEKIRSALSN